MHACRDQLARTRHVQRGQRQRVSCAARARLRHSDIPVQHALILSSIYLLLSYKHISSTLIQAYIFYSHTSIYLLLSYFRAWLVLLTKHKELRHAHIPCTPDFQGHLPVKKGVRSTWQYALMNWYLSSPNKPGRRMCACRKRSSGRVGEGVPGQQASAAMMQPTPTGTQAGMHACMHACGETGRQGGREAGRQGRQVRQTHRQTDRRTDRQTDACVMVFFVCRHYICRHRSNTLARAATEGQSCCPLGLTVQRAKG